jgi:hypothetical protein
VVACFAWAPWVQADATSPSSGAALGFAPLWTTSFKHVPGARVEWSELATHVGLAISFAALIGLGQALRRPD